MTIDIPEHLQVSQDKRVLNEFSSKILNEERVEKLANIRSRAHHLAPFSDTTFHCECDDADCDNTISMSTEMYEQVHKKTKQFIVVPAHVRLDIENVMVRLPAYVVVEKHFPHPINVKE